MGTSNISKCSACGKRWVDHDGIQPTCDDLQKAKKALRVVVKWVNSGGAMPPAIAKKLVAAIKGD